MDNIIKAWIGSDNISKYNEESGCIDVFTPHALIQIAGFVKYKMKDDIIVYRGKQVTMECWSHLYIEEKRGVGLAIGLQKEKLIILI